MLKGHLTLFLYYHKLPSFFLFDRSLVGVSISPSDDVMRNHVSPDAEATAAWHIGPFRFPRFTQVVSRPKARSVVLFIVFSGYSGYDLRGAMPCHQIVQHFPPSTYALLRALSIAHRGLIPKMYLCTTVDLVRDMGSDQWAISMLFGYLFNASLNFL